MVKFGVEVSLFLVTGHSFRSDQTRWLSVRSIIVKVVRSSMVYSVTRRCTVNVTRRAGTVSGHT